MHDTHATNDDDFTTLTRDQLQVRSLGACHFVSPLAVPAAGLEPRVDFVPDDARVLASPETRADGVASAASFEKAGPRRDLCFEPARVRAGIVTCGGLCPGINSVIRSLVLELHFSYGVAEIFGFRFGYEGLTAGGLEPQRLVPANVTNIHAQGGSILGVGRGSQDMSEMVSRLRELGVNALFAVGGDGTLAGAHALVNEAARQGLPISVVGVPKTIDNDIPFVEQTFGFDSAVEIAAQALSAAHTEATSARHGIGVVKLMGREAGFVCAHAALASQDVNFCLIPEAPFELEGQGGLLEAVEARLTERGHAVIAVAEGCGLELPRAGAERDASGNLRFSSQALDVGPRLCGALSGYFQDRRYPVTVKYIDPSYMIRSVAANASDNRYCDLLARAAVHAAMAGKTDLVIARAHGCFTHVPLSLVTARRKRVALHGALWSAVRAATGQGSFG